MLFGTFLGKGKQIYEQFNQIKILINLTCQCWSMQRNAVVHLLFIFLISPLFKNFKKKLILN